MKLCIVGTGRCGTKLLGTTFHKHPEFAVFNETHWIPKMYEFFGEQKVSWRSLLSVAEKTTWVGGECLLEVNSRQANIKNHEEFLDELKSRLSQFPRLDIRQFSNVLAQTLFGEGISWGDKTPDYGYYMGLLHQLWPDCKFIHLIRRPVATAHGMSLHPGFRLMVSSGHDNWCPLSFDRLYQSLPVAEPNIGQFIRYWSRRVTRIRDEASRIPSGQYVEVYFEELVANPHEVLTRLADYVGVDPLESWLEGFSKNVDQSRVVTHFPHLR